MIAKKYAYKLKLGKIISFGFFLWSRELATNNPKKGHLARCNTTTENAPKNDPFYIVFHDNDNLHQSIMCWHTASTACKTQRTSNVSYARRVIASLVSVCVWKRCERKCALCTNNTDLTHICTHSFVGMKH